MKKILFFVLVGFFISACNTDESILDSNYSAYITEKIIDTDINFMTEEIYENNAIQAPLLKLKLVTANQFPCVNYGLITTTFKRENELIIRFEEVLVPTICLTAIGPAISYLDLDEDITQLTFINGTVIDKYSITIDQEKIAVTAIESNFTNSLYEQTFRIPENSFAYVCGTNTNNTNIYGDFLAILEQDSNFSEFQFDGEGRIPYRDSSDGYWVNHPSRFFTYSDSTTFRNLDLILNDYAAQNIQPNSGVGIAIYGWNNLNYYSWD